MTRFWRWPQDYLVPCLTAAVLLFVTSWQSHAAGVPSEDEIPATTFDDKFSTNWLNTVRATLPASYSKNERFDFQAATNSLCEESKKGNVAAQALWGFVLIALGDSPESRDRGLKLMRDSAEKGYAPAQMNLAYLFEGVKYVRRDYSEAFHWFERAAEMGIADAQLHLGGCYQYGLGTTPDFSMAAKYYKLSAAQTNYAAMKSLGFLMMKGYGLEKNEEEAKHLFMRAAVEGKNRRAMYNLGAIYTRKYPDTNAMIEAFKWMKQSAEMGDPLAAIEMANFYYRGWGATDTNIVSYRFWRRKAAMLGSTEAQYLMGQAYRDGDGVPKDPENSLIWYRKAAAKNHPGALYDLALFCLNDKTNRASQRLASELMLQAAKMGHCEAQFQSALNYLRGDVFPKDLDEGKKWLNIAATNGWANAEFLLFQLYFNGIPPRSAYPEYPKDRAEAMKWLRRAADHEHYPAQSKLALYLVLGQNVEQDKAEAEKFFRSAAEHGNAEAQNDLGYAILCGAIKTTDAVEAAVWCKLGLSQTTDTNALERGTFNLSQAMARLDADQQQEVTNRANSFKALPPPALNPILIEYKNNPEYQQEDGRCAH